MQPHFFSIAVVVLGGAVIASCDASPRASAAPEAPSATHAADTPPAISPLWTHVDTGISPLRMPAMAYDAKRARTVLFGGLGGIDRDDTWEWDGASWARMTSPARPLARHASAMVYDAARERIVLFGGSVLSSGNDDATWEWDGVSWTRHATSMQPSPRSGHAMAYDPVRKRTVLFGGNGVNGGLADTWEYDGSTWAQASASVAPSAPAPRAFHAMAYDAQLNKVVLFGGRHDGLAIAIYEDTWTWDGAAWALLTPPSSPPARFGHAMAYDDAAKVIVMAGGREDDSKDADEDTWTFDGSAWTAVKGIPTYALQFQGMAYDSARACVVSYGGYSPLFDAEVGDTFEWNGDWNVRARAQSPGSSQKPVTAFDAKRGTTVLYRSGGTAPSTWEYDGAKWSLVEAASQPANLSEPAFVFDEARNVVVLAGGTVVGDATGAISTEAWTYDGNDWAKAPALPYAVTGGVGTYDPDASAVRIVGGTIAGDDFSADSIEGDRTGWRVPAATGLLARAGAGVIFDPQRHATLVFGGAGAASATLGDTWALAENASTWVSPDLAVSPPARSGAHLAFDAARARVMLFGGRSATGALGDMWEWSDGAWSARGDANGPRDVWLAMAFDTKRNRWVAYGGTAGDTWEFASRGEACTSDATCDTGHCVDGACCEKSACDACATCASGACMPVQSADDSDSCAGDSTCDALGKCKSKIGGACKSGDVCASHVCTTGVCCEADCGLYGCSASGHCKTSCASNDDCASGLTCDGAKCVSPTQCAGDDAVKSANGEVQSCSPFKCHDGACFLSCETSDQCAAGWVCDETAHCVPTPVIAGAPSCAMLPPRAYDAWWIAMACMGIGVRRRRRR